MKAKRILVYTALFCAVLALGGYLFMPYDLQERVKQKIKRTYYSFCICFLNPEKTVQSCCASASRFHNNSGFLSNNGYIAHGGGIGEFVYTNCKEALEKSIKDGFQYVELDLLETSDGDIIGAHDWGHFSRLTGQADWRTLKKQPTVELKKLKIRGKYTVLSSADICQFMEQNPDVILVTDKIENFELLIKKIPFPDRMIVEVFGTYQFLKALEAGVKYPAYSVLKPHLIEEVEKYSFPLIVTPAYWFNDSDYVNRIKKLHDKGTVILVFSSAQCDSLDFIYKNLGRNISLIYTDKWSPAALPPSPTVDLPL